MGQHEGVQPSETSDVMLRQDEVHREVRNAHCLQLWLPCRLLLGKVSTWSYDCSRGLTQLGD